MRPVEVKQFGGVIAATHVLLVIARQDIVVEQWHLDVHLPIITHLLDGHPGHLAVPAVTKVGRPAVHGIVGHVDDLNRVTGIRVIPLPENFPGLRVQIQHDFPGNHPVTRLPLVVGNRHTLAHVHSQQAE